MKISLPDYIGEVLTVLREAGHPAYVVGGAVRDMLRGTVPHDFDIATSARPEETVALAEQAGWKVADKLGRNFGVVVAVVHGHPVEIAVFRGERYGEDAHRPQEVWFASTIQEDLARRDFTVNAMALDLSGQVIDPFGGQSDLVRGRICTVGDPKRRFREDALRMFRACRFTAQLGFVADEPVLAAISGLLDRVNGLSVERITAELAKILLAEHASAGLDAMAGTGLLAAAGRARANGTWLCVPLLPELMHLVGLPQNTVFHRWDAWRHTLAVVDRVPAEAGLRWAALLHDAGKGLPGVRAVRPDGQPSDHGHEKESARLSSAILTRLRLPAPLASRVVWLVANHMRFGFHLRHDPAVAVRWVRQEARSGQFRTGREMATAFEQLAVLARADIASARFSADVGRQAAQFADRLAGIAASMPVHTNDLAVRGQDVSPPLAGRQIGSFLRAALYRVQDGGLANERDALIQAAGRWDRRWTNGADRQKKDRTHS